VGEDALVPCTPLGCLMLLRDRLGDLSGLNAVVIGRSNIVGKPMAALLLKESCTVTIAHSRTRDLPAVVRGADIVIAAVGQTGFVPCTPLGCLMLLQDHLGDLSGLEAVVIGRSNIVGKPMAQLLTDANATVTIAHSRTRNLADVVRRADIVVAAVGRPEMVRGDWIKPGATVIDVGINRLPPTEDKPKGRLVGDVAYGEAAEVAGAITPVPGGVGPMTIAVLLRNTLVAAHTHAGLPAPEGI